MKRPAAFVPAAAEEEFEEGEEDEQEEKEEEEEMDEDVLACPAPLQTAHFWRGRI
jgi:hypothetical protein